MTRGGHLVPHTTPLAVGLVVLMVSIVLLVLSEVMLFISILWSVVLVLVAHSIHHWLLYSYALAMHGLMHVPKQRR